MDKVVIKVPDTIQEPIRVLVGGVSITEPMGVTELTDLLAMALRDRLNDKRHHGEGGNFYGATHHITTPG